MTTEYDKLVRDRIPAIIEEDGETPVTRQVSGDEHEDYLSEKLLEEAEEYAESRTIEELVDVLTVVYDIAAVRNISPGVMLHRLLDKRYKRGGFLDGIVLERVEDE